MNKKKAMDFFDRYNEQQSIIADKREVFVESTNDYFTNDFEGFNFDIGEKRFQYKVSNPRDIASKQNDLSKFMDQYTNEQGEVNNLGEYHKALYAAKNVDRIAQHFYEQGKADAVKDVVAKSKNIDMTPRNPEQGSPLPGGFRVKAITDGQDATKLKIKKRT
jgi:hypothetical protein